jgi:hypothetical protein
MLLAILRAIRFLWTATPGNRLTPWRSEYLRWRVETYTGKPAGTLRPRDFWHLATTERGQLLRFLRWASDLQTQAETPPQ